MRQQGFNRKVVRTVDTKAETVQRLEVITGVGRRRRWPAEVKAQVVMESLERGAIVSEVARRHGLTPQQLFGWRRQARNQVPVPRFAPVVVDAAAPISPLGAAASDGTITAIEIIVSAVVIRVRGMVDVKTLTRAQGREGHIMIVPPTSVRVLVATKPVDFRAWMGSPRSCRKSSKPIRSRASSTCSGPRDRTE
jgi:transposase